MFPNIQKFKWWAVGAIALFVVACAFLYQGQQPKFGAGYRPVTDYSARTTSFISSSATTIPVNSTNDVDGNEISLSNISPSSTVYVYFNIEPGTTRQELVACSGKTVNNWSSCLRGLAAQGGSLSPSPTLAVAHNAGSRMIMTDIGQFFGEYVSISGDETLYGTKTFNTFPRVTSTTAVPGSPQEFATKFYADTVGAGGFTANNVSSTLGLQAISSGVPNCPTAAACVGINASSTFLGFDSAGRLFWKIDTFLTGAARRFTSLFVDTLDATSTAQTLHITGTPQNATDAVNKTFVDSSLPVYGPAIYGDGSDGAVTTTPGTVNLTRDVFYTTYVVATGTTVNTNQYRIFAQNRITNNGIIQSVGAAGSAGADGNTRTGGLGGATSTAGSMPAGIGGVTGGNGSQNTAASAGSAGISVLRASSQVVGSSGGAGGTTGANAGGSGGLLATASTPVINTPSSFVGAYNLFDISGSSIVQFNTVPGSGAGGGGAGSGSGNGGGGGGSGATGGRIFLSAPTIVNASGSTITAAGGAGGGAFQAWQAQMLTAILMIPVSASRPNNKHRNPYCLLPRPAASLVLAHNSPLHTL